MLEQFLWIVCGMCFAYAANRWGRWKLNDLTGFLTIIFWPFVGPFIGVSVALIQAEKHKLIEEKPEDEHPHNP